MKTIFIPAKARFRINKEKIKEISQNLPKNIAIAYSIQYETISKEIEKILAIKHNLTSFIQVLGCSKPRFPKTTEAVLLIGSGKFHAVSLAYETKLPIYILNQEGISQVSDKEIKALEQKHKTAHLKFLNADKAGILISTKPGQQNLTQALRLKKKLKKKSTYLFISNNIDPNEFENFQIKSWVNTSCPRMDFDTSIINIDKLNLRK